MYRIKKDAEKNVEEVNKILQKFLAGLRASYKVVELGFLTGVVSSLRRVLDPSYFIILCLKEPTSLAYTLTIGASATLYPIRYYPY